MLNLYSNSMDFNYVVDSICSNPIYIDTLTLMKRISDLQVQKNELEEAIKERFKVKTVILTEIAEQLECTLHDLGLDIMYSYLDYKFILDEKVLKLGILMLQDKTIGSSLDLEGTTILADLLSIYKFIVVNNELTRLNKLSMYKGEVTLRAFGNTNKYSPNVFAEVGVCDYIKTDLIGKQVILKFPDLQKHITGALITGVDYGCSLDNWKCRLWNMSLTTEMLYTALEVLSDTFIIKLAGDGADITKRNIIENENKEMAFERLSLTYHNHTGKSNLLIPELVYNYIYGVALHFTKVFTANRDADSKIVLVGSDFIVLNISEHTSIDAVIDDLDLPFPFEVI